MSSPSIYIVAPPKSAGEASDRTERLRLDVQNLCEERGWLYKVYRLRRTPHENQGTRLVMDGVDATRLYKALHRAACAVVQVGIHALVPLHPLRTDNPRHLGSLERFVQHKAVFGRVNERATPADVIDDIAKRFADVECTGERDPRCLPMHVFNPEHDHDACPLTDAVKVRRRYGAPTARTDYRRRVWSPPLGNGHGNDELTVRGLQLRRGYHWDVKAPANVSELITTTEIWKLPPASYLNVSPDATVRGGQSSAVGAKKVFSLDVAAAAAASTKRPGRRGQTGRLPRDGRR